MRVRDRREAEFYKARVEQMTALERQRLEVGTKAKIVATFPEADDWRRHKRLAELPNLVDELVAKAQPEIEQRAREETRQLRRSLRTGERVTVGPTAPWMSNPQVPLAPRKQDAASPGRPMFGFPPSERP
jgi:hypothetical protein